MYFKYGGYRFTDSQVALRTFTTTGKRGQGNKLESVMRVLDVEFEIIADTQSAIRAEFAAISAAVKQDGKDVGFYHDDNSRSAIFLDSSQSSSGVMITQYPSLIPVDGADYCTHHKGSMGFAAEYLPAQFLGIPPGAGQQQQLTSYSEVVSVQGTGGKRYGYDIVDRGAPRRYVLADQTLITATQNGSLEILAEVPYYPSVNPPIWPALLDEESAAREKRLVPDTNGAYRIGVAWSYKFTSASPFYGEPFIR